LGGWVTTISECATPMLLTCGDICSKAVRMPRSTLAVSLTAPAPARLSKVSQTSARSTPMAKGSCVQTGNPAVSTCLCATASSLQRLGAEPGDAQPECRSASVLESLLGPLRITRAPAGEVPPSTAALQVPRTEVRPVPPLRSTRRWVRERLELALAPCAPKAP
jgi:hypothetical protein